MLAVIRLRLWKPKVEIMPVALREVFAGALRLLYVPTVYPARPGGYVCKGPASLLFAHRSSHACHKDQDNEDRFHFRTSLASE
jgi:hypothetical protein